MSHNLPHTIVRSGSFVFNRRVPKAVQSQFGSSVVRLNLGRDPDTASVLSFKLTSKLDEIWASPDVRPVDLEHLLAEVKPRVTTFEDAAQIYFNDKHHGKSQGFEKHVRLARIVLTEVAGNKDIKLYDRNDARAVLSYLQSGKMKTATIRRRLDTLKAIFGYAYIEGDIEKRNPFSRLQIPGEGADAKKRGTFTHALLQQVYREALDSGNEIKLIVPILGETGARLAEIVGLRLCDVDMERGTISITPHSGRRLKTKGSERELPLVGAALDAMEILTEMRGQTDTYLFPRYQRDGNTLATHASNPVNKWLKRVSGGLTCHCLRHTIRDRLRAVEAPLELIDQIGGWSSIGTVGAGYGRGHSLDQTAHWLRKIEVPISGR